jgi:hypothetical protein
MLRMTIVKAKLTAKGKKHGATALRYRAPHEMTAGSFE